MYRTHPLQLLLELGEAADLRGKVDALFSGKHINSTEASAPCSGCWVLVSGNRRHQGLEQKRR